MVCGHSDFIENAVFLSAVQAVGAAAQLRAIRQAAHADVGLSRNVEAAEGHHPRPALLDEVRDAMLTPIAYGLAIALRHRRRHPLHHRRAGLAQRRAPVRQLTARRATLRSAGAPHRPSVT